MCALRTYFFLLSSELLCGIKWNWKPFNLNNRKVGNDSHKRHEKRLIFKIGTIHPLGLNERFSFIWSYPFIVSVFVQQGRTKALIMTFHLFTPLFMFIHLSLIHFAPPPCLLIDFKNSK